MYESTKYEMVLKLCTLSMQAIKAGRANAVSFIHLKFTRKKAHWIDKVSPQSFNHQSLYTVSCIVPFAWYDPFFLLKHFDCTLTKMNFNLFFSPELQLQWIIMRLSDRLVVAFFHSPLSNIYRKKCRCKNYYLLSKRNETKITKQR